MNPLSLGQLVSFLSIGTNLTMLVVAIKISRYIGKIEFQHELMWTDYLSRTNRRRKTDVEITDIGE
jgi:hypothetical protein